MWTLKIHGSAKKDFEELHANSPEAAKQIGVFIREATASQNLLDTFTMHGHGSDRTERHHVSRWERQQRNGRNLWRVKLWSPRAVRHLRIVYALDPPSSYYILGITAHNETDTTDFYDDDSHPFTQRVTSIYDGLIGRR